MKVRVILRSAGKGGAPRPAEKHMNSVILSEAKNPGSCNFNELPGSFAALRMT